MRTKNLKNQTVPEVAKELRISREQAKLIKTVVRCTDIMDLNLPRTRRFVDQMYNPPPNHYLRLMAIDEILETHGVEGFELADGCVVEYCNTGDSYASTVCRMNGKFFIASWGDVVERNEK